MKQLKCIILSLIIGVCVGLWFGTNIGKQQPIFSNPFAEVPLKQTIKNTGEKIMEKSGDIMEKGGQKLEQGGQAIKKRAQEDDSMKPMENMNQ